MKASRPLRRSLRKLCCRGALCRESLLLELGQGRGTRPRAAEVSTAAEVEAWATERGRPATRFVRQGGGGGNPATPGVQQYVQQTEGDLPDQRATVAPQKLSSAQPDSARHGQWWGARQDTLARIVDRMQLAASHLPPFVGQPGQQASRQLVAPPPPYSLIQISPPPSPTCAHCWNEGDMGSIRAHPTVRDTPIDEKRVWRARRNPTEGGCVYR